jgi:hypothetical protein
MRNLHPAHELCEKHNGVATASLIENWIDDTERSAWFMSEIVCLRVYGKTAHTIRRARHVEIQDLDVVKARAVRSAA